MIKNKLEETQPIIYKALKNAIKGRQAPAYLFYGPEGTPKYEAAIFFAQSILCKEDDMACETCNTCIRVKEGEYADLIIIDGSESSISKKDVDDLQERFSKTALEEGNGQLTFEVPEGLYQNVRIVCDDEADYGTDDNIIYDETITNVSVANSAFLIFWANKPLRWGSIGGVTAVAAGAAAFIVIRKRTKNLKVAK